jgi:hypothetical protein
MHYVSYLVLVFLLVGCASRKAGWEKETRSVEISSAEYSRLLTSAKEQWKGRAETEKLKNALETFEKIHAANPNDLQTLIYLTRGFYFLADAHLDDMEIKKQTYEKAAAYGEKAMATNDAFKKKVSSGKSLEESLDVLTKSEVPAIYWTAASLGKWAKATGIAAALKYKTRIKALIGRVEELDSNFFFGAAQRYWGGFYAVAPSFAGGDLKKSKTNFERSISIAPEYIGTKVLMAEVYWTKAQDKKEFEKMLKDVLSSNYDNHPEVGPENMWEKKKAKKLLDKADELF